MENLLKSAFALPIEMITNWFPQIIKTGLGIIGDFIDAIGIVWVIIGAFAVLSYKIFTKEK